MTRQAKRQDGAVAIDERALEAVAGGLLLPAVQKVREAANRLSTN